jgi:hypothetical protein
MEGKCGVKENGEIWRGEYDGMMEMWRREDGTVVGKLKVENDV